MTVPSSIATRRTWKLGVYGVLFYLLGSVSLLALEYAQHGISKIAVLHSTFVFFILLLLIPLYRLTYRNGITGLPNRNGLLFDLASPQTGYLAVVNIRGFHLINDAYGVAKGDQILKEIADDLRKIASAGTKIYHSDADVFAFIFNASNPYRYLKEIQETLSRTRRIIDHQKLHLRIEIGYAPATYPHALRYATRGVYVARQNRMFVAEGFANESEHLTRTRLRITDQIYRAIRDRRIEAWYMPIQDVKNGKIVSYEALARLRTENGKIILPQDFVENASEHGTLSEITLHILDQALTVFADRSEKISINISHLDLESPVYLKKIIDRLKRFPEPARVCFEITENSLFLNRKLAEAGMREITRSNAAISIDDFGVGYSNLSRIAEMDVSEIKIDGSLIAPLTQSMEISSREIQNKKHVVESLVNLAKRLSIETCAEYVETDAHIEICRSIGIDRMQGYAIGQPQPQPLPVSA